jgi:hypothetical protein
MMAMERGLKKRSRSVRIASELVAAARGAGGKAAMIAGSAGAPSPHRGSEKRPRLFEARERRVISCALAQHGETIEQTAS